MAITVILSVTVMVPAVSKPYEISVSLISKIIVRVTTDTAPKTSCILVTMLGKTG